MQPTVNNDNVTETVVLYLITCTALHDFLPPVSFINVGFSKLQDVTLYCISRIIIYINFCDTVL